MKRVFSLLLVFCLLLCTLPRATAASSETIYYLEDGSYIIVTLEQTAARNGSNTSSRTTYSYYSTSNELCWTATLAATFNYTGTSATCTSAICTTKIYNSNWYEISNTTTRSGGTATTNLTMGKSLLGVQIETGSRTITLTCDKNGNIS